MIFRVALLLALLVLTFVVYSPGFSGDFLFDDQPTLSKLGDLGGVGSLDTFYAYLKSGFTGPTGRPIALLSFLIDDYTWPTDPEQFKTTNTLLHLLTGLFLLWASYRLLLLLGWNEGSSFFIALLAAAFWLLHPLFVSTTLYVVQRMAQLSTLFALAGILAYLHGRSLLPTSPRSGLLWMTLAIVAGTTFATLSKENGALLPLLVLVMEWTFKRQWTQAGPPLAWRIPVLWLPSAAVILYLLHRLSGSGEWPTRAFTMHERLLTQPRILWEYLYHLYFPKIQTRGLFQDGYNFSTGFLTPPLTTTALAGVGALFLISLIVRHRAPLVTFAILFFLAGHLLESTTLSLELYFEHRNYLPAAFLFLPVAAGIFFLRQHVRLSIWIIAITLPVVLLATLTHQRATLWGDTPQLMKVWAQKSPQSARAQSLLAQLLYDDGHTLESIKHLEQATGTIPESGLLSVRLLIHQIGTHSVTSADFERAISLASIQPFDRQTLPALGLLVDLTTGASGKESLWANKVDKLLIAYLENPAYQRVGIAKRFIPYSRMRVFLASGDSDSAVPLALETIKRYRDTDTALSVVAYMANSGFAKEALDLVPEIREVFGTQSRGTMKRRPASLEREIDQLEMALRAAVRTENETRVDVE